MSRHYFFSSFFPYVLLRRNTLTCVLFFFFIFGFNLYLVNENVDIFDINEEVVWSRAEFLKL